MAKESRALRILVIAPHPDDDLIGCGGSMAMHLEKGNEVFVIYVTNGDAACQQFPPDEFTKIRKEETLNAGRCLGLKVENLFFLDEQPWRINEEKTRFELLDLIRQIRPDVCYIPHSSDAHLDHRATHRAALEAINMAPSKWFRQYGSTVEEPFSISIILAYEVWAALMTPNYFEDITLFLEKKMQALREHKTQATAKYEQAYRGMNAFRGAMHEEGREGVFSEAFQIIKIVEIFH
ncbi:MAG: PIG-L family deacetylase [Patescibacteria group bacterium]|nr:PIG-L family deacetylase [Patescibacteria group bacterium]